jgi:hypothetical protein
MCDYSETNYFLKYWDYSADHKLRYPNDPRWEALSTTGPAGHAGSHVPWNRQGMLCNGFMRLAQCHTLLADNSPLTSRYKRLVTVASNDFVAVAYPYVVNTHNVYDWGYVDGSSNTKPSAEQCNVHGDYDIFLLTEAYTARYSTAITTANLTRYADTVQYVINLAHDSFGQNVDGGGTAQSYLDPYWLPLCQWNRSLYTTIAQASIDDNRYNSRPVMDAYILYFKHWNFTH